MLKKDHEKYFGKDKYEGMLMDILEILQRRLQFKFKLYEVKDNSYGSLDENGEWNGMVREVIDGVNIQKYLFLIKLPVMSA